MTESDWLASSDPQAMLEYLCGSTGYGMALSTGRASSLTTDRKLRLFACACWHLNELAPKSGMSLDGYERIARDGEPGEPGSLSTRPLEFAQRMLEFRKPVAAAKAALLRDIIGNPHRLVRWRQTSVLKCGICGACGHTEEEVHPKVIGIAGAIYADRRFEDMPILADALEEAGCTDEAILRHCRGWKRCPVCASSDGNVPASVEKACEGTGWVPLCGPHVRGCHVLDLILGKE